MSLVTVDALMREDHGDWDYHTAIGRIPEFIDVEPASWESKGAAWVPVDEVDVRPVPAVRDAWLRLRQCLRRPVLVVDAANVMGSRPDGWWRDRVGAATRLRDQLDAVDRITGMAPFDVAFPEKVLVVEGKASTSTPATRRSGWSPPRTRATTRSWPRSRRWWQPSRTSLAWWPRRTGS